MQLLTKIIFYFIFLGEIFIMYSKYNRIINNYSSHDKDSYILFTLETDAQIVASLVIIISGLLCLFSVIDIKDGIGLYFTGWLPEDILSFIIIHKSGARERILSIAQKTISETDDISISSISDKFCHNKKILLIGKTFNIIWILLETTIIIFWIISCFVSVHMTIINNIVNYIFN